MVGELGMVSVGGGDQVMGVEAGAGDQNRGQSRRCEREDLGQKTNSHTPEPAEAGERIKKVYLNIFPY